LGRHSSREQGPYIWSVVTWAVPWVVLAVIVGAAVWIAVDTVGGDGVALDVEPQSPSPEPAATPTRTPTTSPAPVAASPTPARTPTPDPSPTPKAKRRKKDGGDGGLITQGVTVQVLNGTGGIEGAAEAMADRLAQLGFHIEAVTDGLTVSRSVVYWSTNDARDAAMALARHLGWWAAPAPENLSAEVDLHVIVSAADAGT
jgi:hypothetical protein